jgi:four helix bundle protein
MKLVSYRDLIVWQKALALCCDVYKATRGFPSEERCGLTAEARKTARSVVSNIAEGHRRHSTAEYIRFLRIARGSGAELETQIILASRLTYLEDRPANALLAGADEIERMLVALIRAMQAKLENPES